MVRVDKVMSKAGNKVVAVLFADAKADVVSNLKIGEDDIVFGSRAVTADGDIAFLDSEGVWHWYGEA